MKPCSQDPNKCPILLDFVRPKVMKIILQSNLAIWHPKKRCTIISSFMQKQHCLLPFQWCLAKLSFVRIAPWWSSQINNFTFKGIFNFHTGLFMGRFWTSNRAEYIERIENWQLLWSYQIPISLLSPSWMLATRCPKSIQSLRLFPVRCLLNETFKGSPLNTVWTVTCLRWTRLNKLGYCSLRADFPNH